MTITVKKKPRLRRDGRRRRTALLRADDPLYRAYHDDEWGRPVRDERGLYERISLEAFQSGLAWITILRKRDNFRAAFAELRARGGRGVR